ncbi:MAG: hypothetical protein LUG55_00530 [Clostridiales bacterium]|nr:hypothetical protein [Clostridiales bacterium]
MKHYQIESQEILPERWSPLASRPEREQGIRQLLVDNYSAFYVVGDSKVTILRMLYSASDIAARL